MQSPFPGMDPFLEGYLWPDVHNRLANVIAELIAPLISPKYVARIELYTVEDTSPEEEVGIMYPDVEAAKVTISIPIAKVIEVRIPFVEIRDWENNQLITAIKILSPVNKREPGLKPYREKRKSLHHAGVHLLEIDLLRRGIRPFVHPYLPKTHYLVTLLRGKVAKADIWGFDIKDKLPVVAVPLRLPDADVPLNLGQALITIYQRSLYHLSIDYQETPPPPVFTEEEQKWIETLSERKSP